MVLGGGNRSQGGGILLNKNLQFSKHGARIMDSSGALKSTQPLKGPLSFSDYGPAIMGN